MKEPQPDPKPDPRRRRLLLCFVAAVTLLPVLAILALPWGLNTEPARVWLLSRANRVLAPGAVEMATLRFSWFRPTRITGFVLLDAKGDRVIASPHAYWDRNLFQVLFQSPRLGRLRLDEAQMDVERGLDGSINLVETLRPIIKGDPRTAIRIEVLDGRLRVHGKGLARPVEAEHAEVSLDVHAVPGPVAWTVRLANGDVKSPRSSLEIEGMVDRHPGRDDLDIRVSGQAWPWAFDNDRGSISGQLDGTLSASKTGGRWTLAGHSALAQLKASSPDPNGQSFQLDQLRGVWKLGQTGEGWTIETLALMTSQSSLTARGHITPTGVQLDGEAALNGDLRGRWSALGSFGMRNDVLEVDGKLDLVQIVADSREGERLGLRLKGSAPRDGGRIDLASLALDSRFLRFDARGHIDDPTGKRLAALSGTIAPNWENLSHWLGENIEPGARVAGRDHSFRLRAALDETLRDTIDGEIGLALDAADLYGMKFGPTALVVRARQGKLSVDPIDTMVNDGRLHLEPQIRPGDDSEPMAILLDRTSSLAGAKVNDEVSRRVLSFVAPVLDNATSVRGQLSATIERAVFPIGDDGKAGAGRGPTIEGSVEFQDVEFLPGPLLDELFAMTGKTDRPTLKLNEPVALRVADRRVHQRGLSVPIGNLTKFELEGSVGFDRSLNLTASMPILPTMLADRPLLGAIAADARIKVPIRGTPQHPEIDREAFKLGMNDLGRSLLERGGIQGAVGLFERLIRPRDPNAPPPPTAEERREHRQERREERKLKRQGMTPD